MSFLLYVHLLFGALLGIRCSGAALALFLMLDLTFCAAVLAVSVTDLHEAVSGLVGFLVLAQIGYWMTAVALPASMLGLSDAPRGKH
jgi:hypothetical protein